MSKKPKKRRFLSPMEMTSQELSDEWNKALKKSGIYRIFDTPKNNIWAGLVSK